MSEQQNPTDDGIEELIRLAGPRPSISPEARDRVFDSVRGEWRRSVRRQAVIRWSLAAAAAFIVILVFVARDPKPSSVPVPVTEPVTEPVTVAEIVVAPAPVSLVRAERAGVARQGETIQAEDVIQTPRETGASIDLPDGISLRLDRSTRLEAISTARFRLITGAVYVDSGPGGADRSIAIDSGRVEIRDIGTQFEVRRIDAGTRVRVREGHVTLRDDLTEHTGGPGDELLSTTDGTVQRGTVSASDPSWQWAVRLAPPLKIEGRTLETYLSWISRETGFAVRLESSLRPTEPSMIELHGSIEGMTPLESLHAALPISGMAHRIENGQIIVSAGGSK